MSQNLKLALLTVTMVLNIALGWFLFKLSSPPTPPSSFVSIVSLPVGTPFTQKMISEPGLLKDALSLDRVIEKKKKTGDYAFSPIKEHGEDAYLIDGSLMELDLQNKVLKIQSDDKIVVILYNQETEFNQAIFSLNEPVSGAPTLIPFYVENLNQGDKLNIICSEDKGNLTARLIFVVRY